MRKLASLRQLFTQAIPELARDPQRLIIQGDDGHLVATGTGTLSFEYRYTASITVLDYTGHADAIMVPLLAWVQTNQGELLDNPQRRENAIRFAIAPLDSGACDIGIEIDLTESAIVRPQPDHPTRLTITHPPEPGHIGLTRFDGQSIVQEERWELWLKDQKLAEWQLLPPAAKTYFGL